MAIKKSKHFFEDELIETIGEVSEELYKPLDKNEKLNFVGKKIKRYDEIRRNHLNKTILNNSDKNLIV